MAFHDVIFPTDISYGSRGGPKFSTTVLMLASGYEKRNQNWSKVKAEYNVSYGIKDEDDMALLRVFFYARAGRAYSFRFYDWADHSVGVQQIGTGDGLETAFQIIKEYTSGGYTYTRDITKPISGSLLNVAVGGVDQVEGVDYTVDYATGIITFVVAPPLNDAVVIGACEFHVHVRFDTDHLDASHEFWRTQSWPDIPLVEVKE